MPLITWTDSLSVGIPEFDLQHKKLVGMVNDLHDAMAKGQAGTSLGPLFSSLITYTVTHFAAEEKRMIERNYPDYAKHKAEHEDLKAKVSDLKTRFDGGQSMLTIETMRFLKDWLTKHIQGTDKLYTSTLK